MKIIVLGGAGEMGSRAVEDLVTSDGVAQVTIADRNTAAADALARRLAGSGAAVAVRGVDADEHAQLVAALRGHDVAASALGPFHRFETTLVRAAIEAGVDYASVCDEWQPAQAVLDEWNGPARERGRVVVTGLGASPGLTNVGVRYLSRQMDALQKVEISCYQPLDAGGGEAVIRHMLFIMTGDVAVWRHGRRTTVPACSESRLVEFPRFGRIRLWNMGHSEPLTVPRFFPGLEEVNFFMGFGRGAQLFVRPAQRGWFASRRFADLVVRATARYERSSTKRGVAHGALRIDAWGVKDGAPVHRLVCGVGEMRTATGLSLSIGAQMVARRELLTTEPGAYAPEGCLDPDKFIGRMRARGLESYEDLAMTRPLAKN
jgi:saccharopine dehydrogenase-like NADP-dependent oxidoreductase